MGGQLEGPSDHVVQDLDHSLRVHNELSRRKVIDFGLKRDLGLFSLNLVYVDDLFEDVLRAKRCLLLFKCIVFHLLQVGEVLNVELHHAGTILYRLQRLPLLICARVNQLLGQHDERLCGHFDTL